jgi:peptide/nickel transport system permease protein
MINELNRKIDVSPGEIGKKGFSPETSKKTNRSKYKTDKLTWVAVTVIAFWIFIAFFGPLIAPYDEAEMISEESFLPICAEMVLGSDYIGRDVFSRVLYGARMTMGLALLTTILAFIAGMTFGFTAAVAGGWMDTILSRVNDAIMSFPSIMLALIVISSLGTSLPVLIVTIAILDATRVFRLSRALGMDFSVMEYVDVARARGEGLWWIISREILPNTIVLLSAEFGLRYTFNILFISALSFLGLGVQPPLADWGVMVRENIAGLLYGSTAGLAPAAAIASLTISINLIVDAMLKRINKDISEEML